MATFAGDRAAPSTTRSPVLTRKGLVCSISPLAGSIGAQVLRGGGNAFDAAIAIAAAEAVTIPPMCGLGGEVFALLYEASTGALYGLTGSGRAPLAATRARFVSQGLTTMPRLGPVASSVPGEVDAWATVLRRFGTRPLADLIAPAIELAEQGFPLPPRLARYFANLAEKIARFPTTAALYLRNEAPLRAGDVIVNRDLGRSLRRIAEGGPGEFYRGALGREFVAAVQAAGGLITVDDLAAHQTVLYANPPSTTYRGLTVATNDLPSHGFLVLEMLNILEGFDLAGMGHNTPETVHVETEAMKLAFADRLAYAADPRFLNVPPGRGADTMSTLLSKGFAAERRARIDRARAAESVAPGAVPGVAAGTGAPAGGEHTSYFCVVDAAGNAVSFIHSLSAAFGCGFVAGDTGILMNDRAARGFFLDEGHPNALEPGKRTVSTLHAWMALSDGKPVLIGGTPGGDGQPQWNVQTISNVVDYGMSVQQAVEAPRWNLFPGTDAGSVGRPFELRLDTTYALDVRPALVAKGHRVRDVLPGDTVGAAQLIELDHARGVRYGGTDPRADGVPVVE